MKLAWPGKTGQWGFEKDPLAATIPGGGELPSVVSDHDELVVLLTYSRHPGVGLDLDREGGGLLLEVVRDLVTGRVSIRVAEERSPGHRAVGGR